MPCHEYRAAAGHGSVPGQSLTSVLDARRRCLVSLTSVPNPNNSADDSEGRCHSRRSLTSGLHPPPLYSNLGRTLRTVPVGRGTR